MSTAVLSFSGQSILCLLDPLDWSGGVRIRHALPVSIEEGLSGRENRRAEAEALRLTVTASYFLDGEEAQALRVALASLYGGRLGLPLWVDALSGAEWASRIYDPEIIIDLTAPALLAKGATLNPAHLYAPLVVGRLEQSPELAPFTGEHAGATLTVVEDGPHAWRVGANALAASGTWPALLAPDWSEPPTETARGGIERQTYGRGRESAIEGAERAFRWGEEARFQLASRDELRALLAFFLASQGQRTPFTQAWWWRPGTPTAQAPHESRVRFASDRIDVDYMAGQLAVASVAFLQVPWEVEALPGEAPAQAALAYLYRYTLQVPGSPVVWRFTDWERPLSRIEELVTVDYLPRPMQHDRITQDYRLGDEGTKISSGLFADHPFLRFVSRTLEAPLGVEIFECDPADPSAARLRYAGEVADVKVDGRRLSASTSVLAGALEMKLPAFLIQSTCNYALCGHGCNGAGEMPEANWTFAGTLVSATGTELVVAITSNPPAATLGADYFAKAWIKKGTGAAYEARDVIRSVNLGGGQQRFTLKRPFSALTVGQVFEFMPYCGGTWAECKTKFSNSINFGGHRHVQTVNPTLPSRETTQQSGKK